MAADGLGQEVQGRPLVPVLRVEKVNGLAALIHGTIQIVPLAFKPNIRLVHPPAAPDGALAAVEGRFELRAIFQDPAVDRRMIDRHPALLDAVALDVVTLYRPYWAVRAHFLQRLGRKGAASDTFDCAIGLTEDDGVRRFLLERQG